ncbi:MAG: mitochondrial fission ELM1 family protein [Magnetospirillum sp.]|nr:mitochondrial fission ELM1 family protein [Magnetospirillum sp.]
MTTPTAPKTAWIISPGQVGMKAQCRGIAEALGLAFEFKDVAFRPPYSWLPEVALVHGDPLAMLTAESPNLSAPWPDVAITLGSRCAPIGVAMKRRSGGKVFALHVQRPAVPVAWLDAVVAPAHDEVVGANVIETQVALHHVTPAKLAAAAELWAPKLAGLKRPLIAVILGGSNGWRRFQMTEAAVERLASGLKALAASGCGLALTPSRRTDPPAREKLVKTVRDLGGYAWDGEGDNPYLGLLAVADGIVVTEDSVSMTSEALSTGKPVFVAALEGRSGRIAAFQAGLQAKGFTRPFEGRFEHWTYAPPDDTARAARLLQQKFGWG